MDQDTKTFDVSIEYAHIYTNDEIGKEHELSVKVLGDLMRTYESDNKSVTLCVMVDDYSFPDPTFDYNSFLGWLAKRGYKPDLVFRESQLIPLCDQVVGAMNESKTKRELIKYIRSNKYPCSLFVASWYLLRLGRLEHNLFDKQYYANRLVSILPVSFKPHEDRAIEIIKGSSFSDCASLIEQKYFEGREI